MLLYRENIHNYNKLKQFIRKVWKIILLNRKTISQSSTSSDSAETRIYCVLSHHYAFTKYNHFKNAWKCVKLSSLLQILLNQYGEIIWSTTQSWPIILSNMKATGPMSSKEMHLQSVAGLTNQKNIYALIKKEYSAKRIDYTL